MAIEMLNYLSWTRMCIDFMAKHKMLKFMDTYSSYNQISLCENDEEKKSFITYMVMPFGINCVGSTYQMFINKMLKRKIGRNVEVHVYDLLVKRDKET